MVGLGVLRALAGAVALGALVVTVVSLSSAGPVQRTGDVPDDTVVARLSSGPMPGADGLAPLLLAVRTAPDDVSAAERAASALIAAGRQAGNSRLVGAALGVLRPFLAAHPGPVTLRLAAEARQYQHDFPGALSLLDQAIAADPQDSDAILMRATVHLVRGEMDQSRQDCTRLHALRPDVGLLCQSTTLTMTAQASAVATRLAALRDSGVLDPTLGNWATSLMGEIALLQNQPDLAARDLSQVLQADPHALRERLMLADLMLGQGKSAQVTALLQDAPPVDGVLIRRILASGDAEARAEMARRVQLNLQLGLNAHAREDAMYLLWVARDPARALDRALANWALQHEAEDARLLLQAADAAGQPEAARPVVDWMKANGISAPGLGLPASIAALVQGGDMP